MSIWQILAVDSNISFLSEGFAFLNFADFGCSF